MLMDGRRMDNVCLYYKFTYEPLAELNIEQTEK